MSAAVLPMRRLGSGVTHLVAIQPETLGVGHFVSDFRGTEAPVVTVCAATLNGTKVWMQNGALCRRCERLASHHGHEIRYFDPAVDVPTEAPR